VTVPVSASAIREDLRLHLAEVLCCETGEIADDATFKDLGLDSVLGVELVSMINANYGLQESIDAVYEHPTLVKLADYVRDRATAGETSRA
jgi:acyl carrier protein